MVEYDKVDVDEFDPELDAKAADTKSYKILKAIDELGWLGSVEEVQAGTLLVIDFSLSPEEPNLMQQAQGGVFGSSILYSITDKKINRAILRLGHMDMSDYMDIHHAKSIFEHNIEELDPPGDRTKINLGDFDQGIKHVNLYGVRDVDDFIRFLEDALEFRGTFENPEE